MVKARRQRSPICYMLCTQKSKKNCSVYLAWLLSFPYYWYTSGLFPLGTLYEDISFMCVCLGVRGMVFSVLKSEYMYKHESLLWIQRSKHYLSIGSDKTFSSLWCDQCGTAQFLCTTETSTPVNNCVYPHFKKETYLKYLTVFPQLLLLKP